MIKNKQSKFSLILILIFFINCKKSDEKYLNDFKNYEVILSNNNYAINLKNGKIESDYFGIVDSIKFSKNEELQFSKIFFDNNLEKLNGDVKIYNDDGIIILPDIGTSIKIKYYGKDKSTINISGYADSLKVRKSNIPYLRFESKAYKILKKNKAFQKIKKNIDSKNDDRFYI